MADFLLLYFLGVTVRTADGEWRRLLNSPHLEGDPPSNMVGEQPLRNGLTQPALRQEDLHPIVGRDLLTSCGRSSAC